MEFTCQAVLFDLDGVLVDSTAVVRRCWTDWAERHGLDVQEVLACASGRPIVEVIQDIAPHLNATAEARRLATREANDTEGLETIPGASTLLHQLSTQSNWGVVTSGRRAVARKRLRYADLPRPPVFVTADDVSNGKPHPAPYLQAAKRINVSPRKCLVLEDAPAGVQAAQAAGMQVIGVTATRSSADLTDLVDSDVCDLRDVEMNVEQTSLHLSIES